jgi:hypothetical protein
MGYRINKPAALRFLHVQAGPQKTGRKGKCQRFDTQDIPFGPFLGKCEGTGKLALKNLPRYIGRNLIANTGFLYRADGIKGLFFRPVSTAVAIPVLPVFFYSEIKAGVIMGAGQVSFSLLADGSAPGTHGKPPCFYYVSALFGKI